MGSKHLTYEVVQKALADDSAAIVQIINFFDGLITHLSIRSKVDRDGAEELYGHGRNICGRVDWPLAGPAPLQIPACGFSAPGSLQG